jgi:hypothetical protein
MQIDMKLKTKKGTRLLVPEKKPTQTLPKGGLKENYFRSSIFFVAIKFFPSFPTAFIV